MFLKDRPWYIISKRTFLKGQRLTVRLEYNLETKKIAYLSLWEDVEILPGKLKIIHRADIIVTTLAWLIQHEGVSHVGAYDDHVILLDESKSHQGKVHHCDMHKD